MTLESDQSADYASDDREELETLIANAILGGVRKRRGFLGPFDALAAAKNVLVELHVNGYEVAAQIDSSGAES